MTHGAIRARERRAALSKRAVVKDNSDDNAKGEVCSYTDDDKSAELDTNDHKGAKRDSVESKFNNNNTKCEAACSDSPLSDKVVNAALLTATLLNTTLMTTKVPSAKLTATKALNVIPAVTKTLNAIPAVTKALNAIPTVTKALNAIPTVTTVMNENLAMEKTTTTTPTVKQLAILMYNLQSRCPGRKRNIDRGKKSTIPADCPCPPSHTAAFFPIQILISFQAANIQDLGAPELVNALSSLAGDPFSNEWLGNKTTDFIMDLNVLAFFMIPRNVTLKVYEEAKVHLENGKDQHLGVEITMDAAIRLPTRVLGGYVNNINSVHRYKQDSRKIPQCLKEHHCSQESIDHFLGMPYRKTFTGTPGCLTDVSKYLISDFVGDSYISGSIPDECCFL
ncbi:hypothetical protein PsorP6_017003 [Peronosclerospora sorghi]|uniref:Uncharacterized protein n=1 Tax=Peronosclerospora sorghi TaxID=230839 RepID=A0ACC0WEM3_9STRA|nr:hypothetical protein PsorP6_017003 [Peronosclerospora sorghi]